MFLKKATSRHLALSSAATIALAMGAPAAFADPVQFNIEDGNTLQTALNEFARQADVELIFTSDLVNGQAAPALIGNYEPEAGLQILLADSGLDFSEAASGALFITDGTNTAVTTRQGNGGAASGPTGTGEPVSVEGTVRGAITDSNLKGARVEIVETGQTTATDDLGRFRFPAVAPGTYTLRISYLGRETIQETIDLTSGGDFSQSFAMGFPSSVGVTSDVEVVGSRSARAQAINQERTAENTQTVVSSDLLGNFTGTTISESLRRAPGVAFQQDFNTGDGTNIIVRGLAPDLNTVTFNGIELPVGDGEGRSADLSALLTNSISSVTINKTLLPNQDSAGIGGLVEIETKTALDRPKRFAQFLVQGAERDDDFSDDLVASAVLSGKFGGSENVGLGVSLQYRDREILSTRGGYNTLLYGAYLPLDTAGGFSIRDAAQVEPGNPFPFVDTPGGRQVFPGGLNSGETLTETENLSLGVNAAWEIGGHTNLRFDAQRVEQDSTAAGSTYTFSSSLGGYGIRPVAELDGESRRALGGFFFPIIGVGGNYSEVETTTDVFTFSGESFVDAFTVNYSLGYTESSRETPISYSFQENIFVFDFSTDWFGGNAVDPVEGIVLSPFAALSPENENIFGPLLSEEGFARINNSDLFEYPGFSGLVQSSGENTRFAADISVRYDVATEWLEYVEFGIDFEESEFSSLRRQVNLSPVALESGDDPTFSDFGIDFDQEVLGSVGVNTGLLFPSFNSVRQFTNSLDTRIAGGEFVATPAIFTGQSPDGSVNIGTNAKETEIAPFVQAAVEFGDFEVIGGFRYTNFEISSTDVDFPRIRLTADATPEEQVLAAEFQAENTVFRTETATQRRLLPRFQVNYRPNDKLVIRGSYGQAIARPQLAFLSDVRQYDLDLRPLFGPDMTPRLFIREGNEDLEPALTDSFDLSAEWYDDKLGVFKLGGFYKSIENLTEQNETQGSELLDGVVLPNFPPSLLPFDIIEAANTGQLFVERTNPVNNDSSANIWGIEASVERQFTELPGIWGGLGFFGNYTYTKSEKEQPFTFRDPVTGENVPFVFSDIDFNQQPEHSGTAAITYNANSIDAALIYSAQSRRQSSFAPNGLSGFEEAFESVDFRFAYLFEHWGGQYQLSLEATDLLRDSNDPTLLRGEGEDISYYTNRSYLGGREIRIGLTATF